jgi:hypothetical protein
VQHPERADQYDTIVVRRHRGYGIDRAIKARMLFELRGAEPGLREVQTWNAQHNESMPEGHAELFPVRPGLVRVRRRRGPALQTLEPVERRCERSRWAASVAQ